MAHFIAGLEHMSCPTPARQAFVSGGPVVTEAHDVILEGVRGALGGSVVVPAIPRSCRRVTGARGAQDVELFAERVAEYGALVRRVSHDGIAEALREICVTSGVRRLVAVVDDRLDLGYVEVLSDVPPLTAAQLDLADGW